MSFFGENMSTKDDNPVEFDEEESGNPKYTGGPEMPPTSEERFKTEAMDAMDETAILDANEIEDVEEKTQLIENPFAKPARLIVVFGPDQGRDFPLIHDESTVGRALDCNVVLNDPTVSKHHCMVVKRADKFFLKDLGSGNGTKLNGEKITESQLTEGARMELGRTVMTFTTKLSGLPKSQPPVADAGHQARTLATEMPVQPVQKRHEPVRQEPASGFPWGRLAGLILLILILAGGVVATLQWGFDINVLDMEKPQPVVMVDSPHKKSLKLYNKGLGFMGDEKWDMAISAFQKALDLDPELRRASRRMIIAQKEKQTYQTLKKADQMLKQNKIPQVKALLTSVSRDSVYFTRARSKLLLLTDRQAAIDVGQVKTLVAAGRLAEGKDLFLKLLGRYPGNTEVLALGKLFEKKVKPKHVNRVKRAAPRRRRHRVSLDMNTVLSMYAGGAFSDAVEELRAYAGSVRDKSEKQQKNRLADSIQRFASMYTAGKQAMDSDDYATAIRDLGQAKRLDRGISRKYQGKIKSMLATAYRGRAAKYVMKKQYVQAVRDARAALGLNPGDKTALMVLNKCNQVARGYYDSALADLKSGNTASARSKLENVMKLVTRDSDLYRQASTRYQQIR